MLRFQYIEYLYLLILVPVLLGLFFYALHKKKVTRKKLGDPGLIQQLTAGYSSRSYRVKFILVLFSVALLVLALANLRKPAGEQKISRNGIDVMIALDVSKSMLAKDIQPNRLERAKQLLSRIVDRLGNNRVGIVIFAGKAYLQMPLTGDHAAARMYLSAASTESVPTQGTVIGDALKMCYASFNPKEKKYKAVILISDGEDHDENAVEVAKEMAKSGVIIHTVGIGSPQGSPLVADATGAYVKDSEGNTVISKLNEAALRSISQETAGLYQVFQNTDNASSNIMTQLNSMEQRTVVDDSLVNYESYFTWILLAVLVLLLIEFLLSEKKKMSNNKQVYTAALTVFFLLMMGMPVQAQEEKELIFSGNEAYKKKDYEKAANDYGQVVKKNPQNVTAQYNLGNAQYKAKKKEEALAAYDEATRQLTDSIEKGNAFYNKAVVQQNDKKLAECIEAYKAALRLDPKNEDARHNLQKALQQQKKEQQKKEQDKKQQKQKQEEQKPKPQPSKLTKQDAENKLKALMQKEKELQDKLHKINNASANKPEKDW